MCLQLMWRTLYEIKNGYNKSAIYTYFLGVSFKQFKSYGSSVSSALDLVLKGCMFKSGIGKSMWDYFHIFCSVCHLCEIQNRDPSQSSTVACSLNKTLSFFPSSFCILFDFLILSDVNKSISFMVYLFLSLSHFLDWFLCLDLWFFPIVYHFLVGVWCH